MVVNPGIYIVALTTYHSCKKDIMYMIQSIVPRKAHVTNIWLFE